MQSPMPNNRPPLGTTRFRRATPYKSQQQQQSKNDTEDESDFDELLFQRNDHGSITPFTSLLSNTTTIPSFPICTVQFPMKSCFRQNSGNTPKTLHVRFSTELVSAAEFDTSEPAPLLTPCSSARFEQRAWQRQRDDSIARENARTLAVFDDSPPEKKKTPRDRRRESGVFPGLRPVHLELLADAATTTDWLGSSNDNAENTINRNNNDTDELASHLNLKLSSPCGKRKQCDDDEAIVSPLAAMILDQRMDGDDSHVSKMDLLRNAIAANDSWLDAFQEEKCLRDILTAELEHIHEFVKNRNDNENGNDPLASWNDTKLLLLENLMTRMDVLERQLDETLQLKSKTPSPTAAFQLQSTLLQYDVNQLSTICKVMEQFTVPFRILRMDEEEESFLIGNDAIGGVRVRRRLIPTSDNYLVWMVDIVDDEQEYASENHAIAAQFARRLLPSVVGLPTASLGSILHQDQMIDLATRVGRLEEAAWEWMNVAECHPTRLVDNDDGGCAIETMEITLPDAMLVRVEYDAADPTCMYTSQPSRVVVNDNEMGASWEAVMSAIEAPLGDTTISQPI